MKYWNIGLMRKPVVHFNRIITITGFLRKGSWKNEKYTCPPTELPNNIGVVNIYHCSTATQFQNANHPTIPLFS